MNTFRNRIPSVLVVSALLLGLTASGSATAQQPAKLSEAEAIEQAKEFFRAGREAVKAGQWKQALESFSEAWHLQKHYQVAGALGRAELMSGRYRDAAEHLEFVLRTGVEDLTPQDKEITEGWYADARSKVASLTIKVDIDGAALVVDGREVGRSPLAHPVFVDPGLRRMEASRDGYEPLITSINVVAGRSYDVPLRMIPTVKNSEVVNVKKASSPKNEQSDPRPSDDGGIRQNLMIAGVITSGAALVGGLVFTSISQTSRRTANDIGNHIGSCFENSTLECENLSDARDSQYLFGTLAAVCVPVFTLGAGAFLTALAIPQPTSIGRVRLAPVATAQGGAFVIRGEF